MLLLSLSGVSWVVLSSIKATLLGCHDSFVGRKWKKVWDAASLCFFWTLWKERNKKAFDNEELSDQGLKTGFICSF